MKFNITLALLFITIFVMVNAEESRQENLALRNNERMDCAQRHDSCHSATCCPGLYCACTDSCVCVLPPFPID
uniref:Secretory peptide n=1 Tax=Heteropoda venatoria TaxID=152925 RepID=A0A088BPI8_HETVE|nr:secretory peptide [Heteropoda venatoria]